MPKLYLHHSATAHATNPKERYKAVLRFFNQENVYRQLKAMVSYLIPHRSDVKLKLNIGGGSYTDGESITVGLPEMFLYHSYEEIFTVLRALVGHEAQHVNSSNFKAYVQYQKDISAHFQGMYRKKQGESKGKVKHIHTALLQRFSQAVSVGFGNGIEDGRIEKILGQNYRGYIKHLKFLNGSMWKMQPVQGKSELNDFLFTVVSLSVTGLLPKDFNKHYKGSEMEKQVYNVLPYIQRGINARTHQDCIEECIGAIKEIDEYLFSFLEFPTEEDLEALENMSFQPEYTTSEDHEENHRPDAADTHFAPMPQQKSDESDESDDENEESQEDSNGSCAGDSEEEENETSDDKQTGGSGEEDEQENSDEEEGSSSSDDQSDSDSQSSSKENEDGEEDGEKSSSGSDSQDSDEDGEDKEGESQSQNGDKKGEDEEGESEGDSQASENDPNSDEDSNQEGEGGEQDIGDSSEGDESDDEDEQQEIDMEEALDQLRSETIEESREKLNEDLDTKKEREQNDSSQYDLSQQELEDIRYKYEARGDYSYVGIKIRDDIKLIDNITPEIRREGKKIHRDMDRYFKNKESYTLRGQRKGVLDPTAIHRVGMGQFNVYMKKGTPNLMDYVGYILEDGSASMYDHGKYVYSKNALAIIEEGLKDFMPLKITNFCLSDYSVGSRAHVYHRVIKNFDDNSKKNYSINALNQYRPQSGNKDGYSIRVATEELMKRPEKDKILIVLSDGLPSAYRTIDDGINDVREAVKEARKQGIIVVAIMFGSEGERQRYLPIHKKMYGHNLISCPPDKIPSQLTRLMRKLIVR